MVTFVSFPAAYGDDAYKNNGPKHPEYTDDDDEMAFDFEDDDFTSGSKLTCPGEPIASSHAFMRFVIFCLLNVN